MEEVYAEAVFTKMQKEIKKMLQRIIDDVARNYRTLTMETLDQFCNSIDYDVFAKGRIAETVVKTGMPASHVKGEIARSQDILKTILAIK